MANMRASSTTSGWASLGDCLTPEWLAELNAKRLARKAELAARRAEEAAAFLAAGGTCAACRDTGILVDTQAETCTCDAGAWVREEQARQAAEALARKAADTFRRAEVWPRYQACTFESFPVQSVAAWEKLQRFVENWDGQRGLALVGSYGTGKTGLMVATMRALASVLAEYGRAMLFLTAPDLMDDLRSGYGDGTFNARLRRAKTVYLLAIDDLGAERPTEWQQEQLFSIFNERCGRQLPTFITTNYGLEDLAERIGPRTFERLVEACDWVQVSGPNLRRLKPAQRVHLLPEGGLQPLPREDGTVDDSYEGEGEE